MPINASYEFMNAEKAYLNAQTLEEKIRTLEEMIRVAPSHKGAENLRAELRTRLKKLIEKATKAKKVGGGKKGIKKEGFQFVLVGFQNSGKSTLLSKLTNAQPKITDYPFTTIRPEIGTFDYTGVKAQMIDLPSLGSDRFDIGIANNADCLIYVVNSLDEIEKINQAIPRAHGRKLIVITKTDLLTETERRKLEAQIKTKRIHGLMISSHTEFNLPALREQMLHEMRVIRVFMKEPGKPKSPIPMVLPEGAVVRDVAEGILKGFSSKVTESRLTGPSSKFPNQKVGLSHVLKDLDTVEFHAK